MIPARFCCFERPLPYGQAMRLQEELVRGRIVDRIPDTILLLQHPPVITLGRRGRSRYLLASPEDLRRRGIECVTSSRGGDITYHGPGQWVLYPIIKLSGNERGAHGYLRALEQIAVGTARHFGVDAHTRDGMAGGWCPEGKFAAIGFKFTRWVTSHGLSLNVNPDLTAFDCIVGCGLEGESVTSFKQVLGTACPEMDRVAEVLQSKTAAALKREPAVVSPDGLTVG